MSKLFFSFPLEGSRFLGCFNLHCLAIDLTVNHFAKYNYPPALPPKDEDSNHTGRLLFGTFLFGWCGRGHERRNQYPGEGGRAGRISANSPLPCPQRMKTATTQAGSCFELFYSGGADKAAGGETKTPKPKSQTRGRKEVALAEEGGGSETTTRKVKLAKL